MRFIVYGAGAIGGVVAALLAETGEDVMVIARGAHAEAIRSAGLAVESASGRRVVRLAVAEDPGGADIGAGDVVLLGMKSQDTAAALTALRRTAPLSTPIVCLQNGVENERAALRLFANVYGVCVMCPAAHLEPGVVQAFSSPIAGLLDMGRYPHGRDHLSRRLADSFEAATFDSVEREDIMRWKYCKLLTNLGNAVEAICHPPGRSQITELARDEGVACLQAAAIDYASAQEDAARRGDLLDIHPVGGQPRGGGSSWQSLQRGAGTIESDYLNGEIVLLGRRHGIPTPVNALLQGMASDLALTGSTPGAISAAAFLVRLAAGGA
ncbi:MAG TPA: 2-dehydropantoate 2-reductase N-terminal domain-containing protein [Acidimicrobiales bacterium]|jgi:2-dehydropantoate 2-reductase